MAETRGVEMSLVLSDDKHFRPFVCSVCVKILSLDAVVANVCSHAYCLECLTQQIRHNHKPHHQLDNGGAAYCPQCKLQLSRKEDDDDDENNHMNINGMTATNGRKTGHMTIASHQVAVQPLKHAQPLAFQCLSWIQVACVGRSDPHQPCSWSGNYADYAQHAANCPCCQRRQQQNNSSSPLQHLVAPRPSPVQRTKSLPSLFAEHDEDPHRTVLPEPSLVGSHHERDHDSDDDSDRKDYEAVILRSPPPASLPLPAQFFRRSVSLRDFREFRGHPQGGDMLPNAPSRTDSPRVDAPVAVVSVRARHDADDDDENDLDTRDLLPLLVHNDNHQKQQQQQQQKGSSVPTMASKMAAADNNNSNLRRNTAKPVPENKRLRKYNRRQSAAAILQQGGSDYNNDTSGDDFDTGDDEEAVEGWNVSINSLTAWGALDRSTSAMKTISMLEDSPRPTGKGNKVSKEEAIPPSVTLDHTKVAAILSKAEKLKKQANAKFNKGDFNAARTLYTEGIRCMADIPRIGPKEGETLSNMHSNRAVTYFREKNFTKCLQDCDVAIRHDPYYEKSWIRKWRALMALGQFRNAVECLENGVNSLPESSKIRKEMIKCKADMDTVEKAKELLDKREYTQVKEMLKAHIRNASMDNIAILHLAARADAYMGLMDSSMEKINRALRYNPNQADGLAVRGAVLYLAGETEKGLHLLQDAYGRDKENKSIKLELQQCQRTHTSLSKGRNCVKRGRYLEAIEHFSASMKEKTLVPEKTPLYAMVRCERAEAWMLSSKYMEALKDCQDVINSQQENATAWTVRAEILIALDKADEAEQELNTIRKSWGLDDPTIEEGYRRVDFELRVLKADEELMQFVATLEQGLGKKLSSSKTEKSKSTDNESRSRRASMSSGGEDQRPAGSERKSKSSSSSGDPIPSKSSRTKRRERQKSTASASSANTNSSDPADSSVLLSPVPGRKTEATSGSSSPPRRTNRGMRKGTSSRRLASSEERPVSSRRLSMGATPSSTKQSSRRHLSQDRQTSSRRLASKSSEKSNERGSVKRI